MKTYVDGIADTDGAYVGEMEMHEVAYEATVALHGGEDAYYSPAIGGPGGWTPGCPAELEISDMSVFTPDGTTIDNPSDYIVDCVHSDILHKIERGLICLSD